LRCGRPRGSPKRWGSRDKVGSFLFWLFS
jgi:hypothetical protein